MRFPWQPRETRAQAYGDAVVDLILSRASGLTTSADSLATAAAEVAAGLWGRAFMAADVLPDHPRADAVTPAVRELIGRELIRRGEALFLIEVEGGRLRLDPATSWDVAGGSHPESWRYEVTRAGPSRTLTTKRVPWQRVVHVRYGVSPDRPWRGVGPLESAKLTAALAGNLEKRLSQEAGMAAGAVIPTPDGVPKDALQQDLRTMDGRVVLVDTMAAGFGQGRDQAPRRDYQPQRIGADPPATLATLRSDAAYAVLAACGVPPEMLRQSDGTGRREAFRQFLHAAVAPVAVAVAAELADKLALPDLELNHDRMMASDIAGRARAFQSMVGGGMATDKAAALAGLMVADE